MNARLAAKERAQLRESVGGAVLGASSDDDSSDNLDAGPQCTDVDVDEDVSSDMLSDGDDASEGWLTDAA